MRDDPPRDENGGFTFRNEQFLLDDDIAVDLVTPTRPWLVFERLDARLLPVRPTPEHGCPVQVSR
jgi:hypothetical protein